MKIIYFFFLLINLSRCRNEPSAAIAKKNVTLDLTLSAPNTPSKVVPNKSNDTDVPVGFKKFVVFGDAHGYYFNVTDVMHNNVNLRINGANISQTYVYDAFSYWNNDQILVFCFRYDYERSHSRYKYFRVVQGIWAPVNGADFEADRYGKISGNGLAKLLKLTESQNPKITPLEPGQKAGVKNKKLLIIIASAVGAVFVLLLVGVFAYYFFKK